MPAGACVEFVAHVPIGQGTHAQAVYAAAEQGNPKKRARAVPMQHRQLATYPQPIEAHGQAASQADLTMQQPKAWSTASLLLQLSFDAVAVMDLHTGEIIESNEQMT